jgi:RND family efflux transporter MFP subunit
MEVDTRVEPHLPPKRPMVPVAIAFGVAAVVALGAFVIRRQESHVNKVALADAPKPVTVVEARAASYRATRRYVGTLEPWLEAKVGPQLVSAYVDTVLVRPGAPVKKGDVLATLDCRTASASSQAVAMQARALEARREALASESSRLQALLDGGFVSPNEAEQKVAQTTAEEAQLLATKAKLLGTSFEVNDCILRAPFEGEVSRRAIDPGAYVRPGTAMIDIVDRSVIRLSADVPESDFEAVAPGTPVKLHMLATGQDMTAKISRRSPAADPSTRTVHFEIDIPDASRSIPVGTTAEIGIEVGTPVPATEVPLVAAKVRGENATVFLVDGDVVKRATAKVLGETGGSLFVDPALEAGVRVVTEGRSLLSEGDRVTPKVEAFASREKK